MLIAMPMSKAAEFFKRISSNIRRKPNDDDAGIALQPRKSKPMNLQAFRDRFLRNSKLGNLPRTGPFAKMPAEIQLATFYYLDYESLSQFRSTCRYYRNFISQGMLDEAKESTKEEYMEKERNGDFDDGRKPCYVCYRVKDNSKFHLAATTAAATTTPADGHIGTRYCIACGVKEKKFKPGEQINAGGQTHAICKHCKRYNKKPVNSWIVRSGWACPRCDREVNFLLSAGIFMRFVQAVFAIVMFALSCSGHAIPRSSHFNNRAWRWIFTVSLV